MKLKQSIYVVISFALLTLSLFLYLGRGFLFKPDAQILISMVLCFFVFLFLFSYKIFQLRDRNWFSFDVLFLFSFWILHSLSGLLYYFQGRDSFQTGFARHALPYLHHIPQISLMSACALAAFALGFMRFSDASHSGRSDPTGKFRHLARCAFDAREVHLVTRMHRFLIIFSASSFITMLFAAGRSYFASSYGDAALSYVSRVSFILFLPVTQVAIVLWVFRFLNTGGLIFKSLPFFYYSSLVLLLLVLGDRGGALYITLTALAAFTLLRFRVRFWQLLIMVLLFGIVMMFGAMARKSDQRSIQSYWQHGVQQWEKSETANPALEGVKGEAIAALPALVMAVEMVPGRRPYFYGYWTFSRLAGILPFYSRFFPFLVDEQRYISSAWFLTLSYFDNFPRAMIGTTMLAEAWLDGGIIGVIGILFLTGSLGGFFYLRVTKKSARFEDVVIYSVFVASFVLGARASFAATLIRKFAWPVGIMFVTKYFLSRALITRKPTRKLSRKPKQMPMPPDTTR